MIMIEMKEIRTYRWPPVPFFWETKVEAPKAAAISGSQMIAVE